MKALAPIVILVALLAGCSSQSSKNEAAMEKKAEASLAAPVDCSTATSDIATLNSEKARTSQEIEDGVTSIVPIGAVAHMFGGSEKQSLEVGTGEYNKKLDEKIAQIKKQCNM
jgi:hypothetical protein